MTHDSGMHGKEFKNEMMTVVWNLTIKEEE
jgi:hypothetical protein